MTEILPAVADIDRRARAAGMPGVLPPRYKIIHDEDAMWCLYHVLPTRRRVLMPFVAAEAACREWLREYVVDFVPTTRTHFTGSYAEKLIQRIDEYIRINNPPPKGTQNELPSTHR